MVTEIGFLLGNGLGSVGLGSAGGFRFCGDGGFGRTGSIAHRSPCRGETDQY